MVSLIRLVCIETVQSSRPIIHSDLPEQEYRVFQELCIGFRDCNQTYDDEERQRIAFSLVASINQMVAAYPRLVSVVDRAGRSLLTHCLDTFLNHQSELYDDDSLCASFWISTIKMLFYKYPDSLLWHLNEGNYKSRQKRLCQLNSFLFLGFQANYISPTDALQDWIIHGGRSFHEAKIFHPHARLLSYHMCQTILRRTP